MLILRRLVPLLLFMGVCIFLWRGLLNDPSHIPSPLIKKVIPEFTQRDLINPQDTLNTQMFIGHISLLNVFASWCVYCLAEHSLVMDIARSEKELKVYGLNYKDKRSSALHWLKQYGNPFEKIIYDPAGTVAINLGVYGTPETFLIDSRGVIRYKHSGPMTPEIWRKEISREVHQLIKSSHVHG